MAGRKKTDRRTEYTVRVIKDAYLELLQQKPAAKISVTEICNLAEINRCTFYLHFSDAPNVMEVLKDDIYKKCVAFINETTKKQADSTSLFMSFAESMKGDKTYSVMVKTGYFRECISKACDYAQELLINYYMQRYDISSRQARLIAAYQINGCSAAAEILSADTDSGQTKEDNDFVHRIMTYGESALTRE